MLTKKKLFQNLVTALHSHLLPIQAGIGADEWDSVSDGVAMVSNIMAQLSESARKCSHLKKEAAGRILIGIPNCYPTIQFSKVS